MTFHITHRYGSMQRDPSLAALPDLLRELDERPDDTEHGSVSLTHESEWCLSATRDGAVIFEHLESADPRHLTNVPPDKIIALWTLLARGQIEAVAAEPWQPGYP